MIDRCGEIKEKQRTMAIRSRGKRRVGVSAKASAKRGRLVAPIPLPEERPLVGAVEVSGASSKRRKRKNLGRSAQDRLFQSLGLRPKQKSGLGIATLRGIQRHHLVAGGLQDSTTVAARDVSAHASRDDEDCGAQGSSTFKSAAGSETQFSGHVTPPASKAVPEVKKSDFFFSFCEPLDDGLACRLKEQLPFASSFAAPVEQDKLNRIKLQESLYLTSKKTRNEERGSLLATPLEETTQVAAEQFCVVRPHGFAQYEDTQIPSYLTDVLCSSIPQDSFGLANCYSLDSNLLLNARNLLRRVRKQRPSTQHSVENDDAFVDNALWHYINAYVDILMTEQTCDRSLECRLLYCIHVVNHVSKSRRRTLANNEKLKKLVARKRADPSGSETLRDQGFTRPKVLILAPFRSVAKQLVEFIAELNPKAKQVMNMRRFREEYGQSDEEHKDQLRRFSHSKKPPDHVHLFEGNQDDCFKIGIRFGTSAMTLYADFEHSDIVIASPLGLRMLGIPGKKKREFDFLSSIEIAILDRADVVRMQNWKFLQDVWSVLNAPLSVWPDCDIRRIRRTFLSGQAACFRQNLIFSDGRDALFNSLLSQSANFRGALKLWRPTKRNVVAALAKLGPRQLFSRVYCSSFAGSGLALVDHFAQCGLREVASQPATLLVVPSHLEYCCLRPHLKENNIDFKSCHESSSPKKQLSARRQFFEGECQLLVTTVRFLFYRRYRLKGAKRVIFLGPPEYPKIYKELVSSMEGLNRDVVCFYTEFHVNELERLIGASKAVQLIRADENKWILLE